MERSAAPKKREWLSARMRIRLPMVLTTQGDPVRRVVSALRRQGDQVVGNEVSGGRAAGAVWEDRRAPVPVTGLHRPGRSACGR
jgi:hypothetical protein